MHHTVDMHVIQRDENAEIGNPRNFAAENLAHFVAHEIGFQPVFHVAAGFVRTPFAIRTMRAQLLPVARVIRFIRQNRLNRTVHQQIGIAADGRCEMRVIVVCQAEMAFVFRFIHRLLHGAQQHGLQGFAVRALGNLFRQFAVVFRFGLVTAAQTQPQQCQLFAQDGQFFGRGAGMVAVECFVLVAQQEICRAYIGCQHAFFNQFVRVVAVHFFNALDFAIVVKNHLRFNGFKFHCATFAAIFLQNLKELV